MNNIKTLSRLLPNESCNVVSINSHPEIRRRLLDMGLIPGTFVTCAFKSPLGDPSAYMIRGALVALRQEDADNILIFQKGDV